MAASGTFGRDEAGGQIDDQCERSGDEQAEHHAEAEQGDIDAAHPGETGADAHQLAVGAIEKEFVGHGFKSELKGCGRGPGDQMN